MDLVGFLQRASARPWRWGEHDCTLFAADWVQMRRGVDPAVAWRGRYRTALGCERLLRRAGGLEAVWSDVLAGLGVPTVAALSLGDIGLVLRPGGDFRPRATGAVMGPNGWTTLTPEGLHIADAPVITAWRP